MRLTIAPRRAAGQRGFTLLELMAVVLIMGTVLLLVPASLDNVGAQGKLKNAANSLVAAFNGARERAILDAFEVQIELGSFRDASEEWRFGWRFRFTSVPPPEVVAGDNVDQGEVDRQRELRARDREWLTTSWHECSRGIKITGISHQKNDWEKISEGGRTHALRFFADGTIENGVALRIVNEDMDTDTEYKTVTVIVNGLTSEAAWQEGEKELPAALPSSNFGN